MTAVPSLPRPTEANPWQTADTPAENLLGRMLQMLLAPLGYDKSLQRYRGTASIGNGVFAKDFTPNASTGVLVWDALDLTASEPVYPAGGLDAAGVRTAIGMASANLDTQLAALPTDAETAVAVLAATVEGAVTVAESLRIQNAVLAGKVSGAGTGTETFRGINDDKDRVVATTDSSGNRTAITLDGT